MTALFKKGTLNSTQNLDCSRDAYDVIEPYLLNAQLDQRFVYYLLASTGICVVPLSTGFNSTHQGFRFTLLESNSETFTQTLQTIAEAIRSYMTS